MKLEWHNPEKTVIIEHATGELSVDDLNMSLDSVTKMMDTVKHKVDIVMVLDNSTIATNVVGKMPEFARKSEFFNHRNLGRTAVVGASGLLTTIVGLFQKVYPSQGQKYVTAASVEEAIQKLQQG
jgi:hypothetical protein